MLTGIFPRIRHKHENIFLFDKKIRLWCGLSLASLFASFLLDKAQGLEIAIRAESVTEATPITGTIRQLPASVDFVEGIMHLREDTIPIINLKKRLGLADKEYDAGALVAVVKLFHRRHGLLFDEIKEVFAASVADVRKIDGALQTDDKIISALIQTKKDRRTVELLDLNCLFFGKSLELEKIGETLQDEKNNKKETKYLRYVVFNFAGQSFGIPVECTQEITFFDAEKHMYQREVAEEDPSFSGSLEDIFKHGDIDGTLTLRGRTIPVLKAGRILRGAGLIGEESMGENSRILVLTSDECAVGIIVDEVTTIETIPENEIMSMGMCKNPSVMATARRKFFFDTDEVLFISLHQRGIFPFSGEMTEVGEGKGEGYTINIPVFAQFGDAEYTFLLGRILQSVVEQYLPQIILVSAGYDGHKDETISGTLLSTEWYGLVTSMLKQYAQDTCGNRLLMVLEGGYNPVSLEACVLTTCESLLTTRPDRIGVFFSERANQLIKNHPLRNYWTLQ